MNNTLRLVWKSESGDNFNVGELSFRNSKYYFEYNEGEVKKAKEVGFTPLDSFPKTSSRYFREELFTTFQRWIGEKNHKEENDKQENSLEALKNIVNDNYHFSEVAEVS
ncbi:hypothetical protein [Clostridium sp.]|uniref:hypothetical protein n=1 Tax=Clostridium sp. TaxID=1506 RepID=UPI002FC77A61